MTRFVKFTENNDNEGESWHFWLQLDGNEAALNELADALGEEFGDEYPEYKVSLNDAEDESVVDVLVRHADHGYMANHNKIVGTLSVPADLDVDMLYKGGIKHLFTASAAEETESA